ncbi:YdcF family protein [Microbacterium sp. A588]
MDRTHSAGLMFSRRMLFRAGAIAYVALAAWADVVHWRSSHGMLGTQARTGASEAVVVLGFRNHAPRANFVNRYRVRAGIRSLSLRGESVLVLCGGAVAGAIPEAELMQRYARDELGYTGQILLDTTSASTLQNIENAIGLIEQADAIKIVSNSPHAEVAREHLWQLRPDLGERLIRGEEHRFGEILPIKIVAALRAVWYRCQQRLTRGSLPRTVPMTHR